MLRSLSDKERDVLLAEIARLAPWFHDIEIAEGIWTNPEGTGPGRDYPASRWRLIQPLLPDVTGKSCLDVGCSSGFFSVQLKQLGARRVVGIDLGEQSRAIEQARFVASVMNLDIEFHELSVYDVECLNEQFDLILFLGVLYHLRHPLLALEKLRSVCRGTMIMQTVTTRHGSFVGLPVDKDLSLRAPELHHFHFPTLRFVEHSLDGDHSVWYVPNAEAVLAMLRATGFVISRYYLPTDAEIVVVCT